MRKNKSSISKASSYEDIGAYWDTQDLSKVWHKTRKVKFDVQIESEVIYPLIFLLHFYFNLITSFQVKDYIWIWQISAFK